MKYSDFVFNLYFNNNSEEELLSDLTEREIETNDKEFFEFCEYLREKLASRADPKKWADTLLNELEDHSWLKERSNGNNGEA